MTLPNTALVLRVGFQPEVGAGVVAHAGREGVHHRGPRCGALWRAVASSAAVDLPLPQTRGPRSFYAHRGLWGALAVWVSTSMLLEPTWQVSNIPR